MDTNLYFSAGDGEQGREMRTLIQVDYQGNVTLLTQVGGWKQRDHEQICSGDLHDEMPDRRDTLSV